jgi:EAL domain-containing protein (putative c-di-GMP-specific phosphodiesterase class I)
LELTEGVLMQDSAETLSLLERLHALGVSLSVDDFGTGYSSLSYLKRFPLHRLKIDRSFVKDVNAGPKEAAIVAAIVALARSLGLRVTAEGVETPEQLSMLDSMGCDTYQGYYFAKPMPPERVAEMMSRSGQVFVPAG